MNKLFLREIIFRKESVPSAPEYPFTLPVLKTLKTLKFKSAITYLIGENGSGKSTLIEAIACSLGINPEGGNKNTRFATRETHSRLGEYLTCVKGVHSPKETFFLRAESFYNLASYVDSVGAAFSYGGNSLHSQSHGEAFMSVLQNKLTGHGLYLLDEPEAALSPVRQLTALSLINRMVSQGAQFIIATHSPILMALPDADIRLLTDKGLSGIKYKETEHYKVTRDFLTRTEKMLDILLE